MLGGCQVRIGLAQDSTDSSDLDYEGLGVLWIHLVAALRAHVSSEALDHA